MSPRRGGKPQKLFESFRVGKVLGPSRGALVPELGLHTQESNGLPTENSDNGIHKALIKRHTRNGRQDVKRKSSKS